MKIVDVGDTQARVDISRDELLIINAALNEVCNGIEIFEFETRVGTSRDRVREFLKEVGLLIDEWVLDVEHSVDSDQFTAPNDRSTPHR